MEFLSLPFLLFLTVTAAVLRRCKAEFRNPWLLLCSVFFYAVSSPRYLWLLLFLSAAVFLGGRALAARRTKLTYGLSVLLVLSPLVYYKYTGFLLESLQKLGLFFTLSSSVSFGTDLLLPLGISFITFQAISYLGDIYYGKLEPEKNLINLCLFLCYFPNVVSGPIQKARHMLGTLRNPRPFSYDFFRKGVLGFAFGALQKYYISDPLSRIISAMLPEIGTYAGFQYLFFALLYGIYIYANFNAYSDMAIGISRILGIPLCENFRRPYLSRSVKEFWQRWHMSLNSWFLDYVYIPMGGSRRGNMRKYYNILTVFFLSGLWHGAGFHFILWGLINAFYQIIGDLTGGARARLYEKAGISQTAPWVVLMKRVTVFLLICFSWLFFAIPDSAAALNALLSLLTPSLSSLLGIKGILAAAGFTSMGEVLFAALSVLSFGLFQWAREGRSLYGWLKKSPGSLRNLIYILSAVFLILGYFSGFQGYGNGGFIYGNF